MAKRSSTPWLRFVVFLIFLAAAVWGVKALMAPDDEGPVGPVDPGDSGIQIAVDPTPSASNGADAPDPGVEVTPVDPPPHVTPPVDPDATPEQIAAMRDRYAQGCARHRAGELVESRKLLSEALASGLLPAADAGDCRSRLNTIGATLVFSREIHPGDPYAREYRVKAGDILGKIVKTEALFVPHEGIMRINLITDDRTVQINQRLKLIQGPFDAIITKHSYTLDLYQHGMFVRSFRIGLGQNGSTPTGRWRVRDRVRKARWTPPAGSTAARTLEWGDPDYPLGAEGLWIALDGMERSNEMVSGFGVHGTNEPDSIGKQASLGCVRLADEDIALLFDLMYAGKSTVEVRP